MKKLWMGCALALVFVSCTKKESTPTEQTNDAPSAAPVAGGPTGIIKGIVRHQGKNPRVGFIKMNSDPVCLKQNKSAKVPRQSLLVNGDGGLKNVFVYLKSDSLQTPGASLPAVTLDQRGCVYAPHVWGIVVGQKLRILNSDPTLHNVHSLAKKNKGFNEGMTTVGQVIEKTFTKPEVMVRIKCDVHGWMTTYAGVLKHKYFAVTDESGNFSIPDVPAGTYTLEAWHEKLGTKTMSVTLEADTATAQFIYG